ncbi:MAG TPA: metal ABC transporter permease [Thermoanaerobaculia bacterium]|nr:metal ABC transporter permease [Thermoanaerobaculia bacterium]
MTLDLIGFLYLPLLAGLILTGIHAYLGVHVVERGVIFVDLSLAQIAALGTTIAYLAGNDLHSNVTYFWSLGFTIIGAAVFAFTRVHGETRIPQEAIIGIAYAVSAAAAILAMSKAPEGTEHLKDMLVGNILTVSKHTVAETAALYAAVGIFHYIFRKKFLAISLGEQIPRIKLWDFLFYTSFGFVVTSSVAIAGVLLVFSYLIVPSVAAMLFARSIGKRLAIGWTMGAVVSAIGIMISFQADLPTGATIVCTFGIALLLLAVIWRMTRRSGRAVAN